MPGKQHYAPALDAQQQVIRLAGCMPVHQQATAMQGLSVAEYERRKEEVADGVIARLERHLPGLKAATLFREVCHTLCL